MPELKTEALNDKVAENLAEFKVATLFTLLFEIKAEVLMNTNIRQNSGLNIRRGAYQKIGLRARKDECNVTTVNESVAELKAQVLVNTGRQTSTSQD